MAKLVPIEKEKDDIYGFLRGKGKILGDSCLPCFWTKSRSTSRFCRICVRAAPLPAAYAKDLADRIIGATALAEGFTLITADAQIRNSGVIPTVW